MIENFQLNEDIFLFMECRYILRIFLFLLLKFYVSLICPWHKLWLFLSLQTVYELLSKNYQKDHFREASKRGKKWILLLWGLTPLESDKIFSIFFLDTRPFWALFVNWCSPLQSNKNHLFWSLSLLSWLNKLNKFYITQSILIKCWNF